MADSRRPSTSRQDLAATRSFAKVSPSVGRLDEGAFDALLGASPDEALELVARMGSATDIELRRLARKLAARIMVRMARSGRARRAGVARLSAAPPSVGEDLDVDASLDALVAAASGRHPARVEDLRWRGWSRSTTSLCLVVDRSGSMSGRRLATAALAAAAVAWRAPDDYSVVAFADDVIVVKAQDEARPVEAVVDDVLSLRGHGTTDIALALQTATRQLARSRSAHRLALLLSDGRATTGADPVPIARALPGLAVLAPSEDCDDAAALASSTGAAFATFNGPSAIPAALANVVG
ncbi:MAG TPA: VWA domain-containing protein [Acidimicrobiales bacterium]|nr:VWA domain-containing protein [Acidimicrobiales bacterium]